MRDDGRMSTDERAAFELEYWKALLGDLDTLNTLIVKASGQIAPIPVLMLEALMAAPTADGTRLVEASKASTATMNVLHEMQAPLRRVLELVDGRVKVLTGS
jgi:hypothetical protein